MTKDTLTTFSRQEIGGVWNDFPLGKAKGLTADMNRINKGIEELQAESLKEAERVSLSRESLAEAESAYNAARKALVRRWNRSGQ